ncbi:MAG: ribonuclease III, partial [Bacillota bacterium]|nr:ribonuclease III [Bacillota bacterium]
KNLSNERLEFLGDAFLDAIVGDYLFKRFPDVDEGVLTKLRAEIVCEKALGNAAIKMGLNEYLLVGKGEGQRDSKNRLSIVSDMVEAILAAVYLDSDPKDAVTELQKVIQNILGETIELACHGKLQNDTKTALQEHFQAKGITDIQYKIIAESGPDHNKNFTAEVYINGKPSGRGTGKSKKEAEANAASVALGVEE